MGPIWDQQDPGGPHVGPINLATWAGLWRTKKCSLGLPVKIIKSFWGIFVDQNGYILLDCTNGDAWIIPSFFNSGLCATCWAHFVCHHKLWPTSVSHPFPFLHKPCLRITLPENTIPIFSRKIFQNFAFPSRKAFQNFAFLSYFPYFLCYPFYLSLPSSVYYGTRVKDHNVLCCLDGSVTVLSDMADWGDSKMAWRLAALVWGTGLLWDKS